MRFTKLYIICLLALCLTPNVKAATQLPNSSEELRLAIEQAKAYDTVYVQGDYCFESPIEILKPLSLIGLEKPSLDFQMTGDGIVVKSDSVLIEGLHIQNIKKSSINDHAAIIIQDAQYCVVRNNSIHNGFFGIYLAEARKCLVSGNELRGIAGIEQRTGNAIHLWQCDSIDIRNNHLYNHRDGIYLEFVTNSLVYNNLSEANIRYGLHFMFSHDDRYEANTFFKNAAGVAVMYSNNVEMIRNHFKDNWGDASYGLLLKDIYDGKIVGNYFYKNTTALLMEGTNRLDVQHNEFVSNGWALKIAANCEGNKINYNVFRRNSFDVSTNGSVVMNGFNRNYWDQYDGYDLDRDGIGDVPFHPVSLFSIMVERVPESLMLYRSFLSFLLDKTEQMMPTVTPSNLVDSFPLMKQPKNKTANLQMTYDAEN